MSLGLRIKTLRKAKSLTQQQLADLVDVSRIYIQALESNRRLPSMKLLRRLAGALDVRVADIVQNENVDRTGRLQLEEVLENVEDIEIWYRSKKLSHREIQLVQKLVDAALSEWDREQGNGTD
ncbi:MAG: helix-turn-helix transcriptional regulator [Thermovirgaceae bacterium]